MNRHTTIQICKMFKISGITLTGYKNGIKIRRKGRVEWVAPPLLEESDYEQVIENGRTKTYYFDSAIDKIRAKRESKKTPEPA